MSIIDEKTTHPSALTAEEKAELDRLLEEDEAAGDGGEGDELEEEEDDGTGGAGEGKDGKADDKGEGAAADAGGDKGTAAATATAQAGADGAAGGEGEGADGKGGTVSRQQFDGVLADLRETRRELASFKSQVSAKPAALPERDFDAEDNALNEKLAALDKRYDNDGDLTDDEYRRQVRDIQNEQRALDRDRSRYEARAELTAQQEAQAAQAEKDSAQQAQQAWETDIGDWKTSLGTWLNNPARRALVDQTMAVMNADPELAQLPNKEYLAKLNEYLGETFTDFPLNTGAAGAGVKTVATERQIAAAKGAAAVTAAPPAINGGVGNRGTTTADIDVENMKLGDFAKLPKEKQDELLGITGG